MGVALELAHENLARRLPCLSELESSHALANDDGTTPHGGPRD